jgi:excisionase family DNA binding protein
MSDDVIDTALNDHDAELVKAAQRCIVAALDHSRAVNITIASEDEQGLQEMPELHLPPKVLRLFAEMLGHLAQGRLVSIVPEGMDVTTQQAANYLNVSRPHIIKLLEERVIPYHKVGTPRKIAFEDLRKYKADRRKEAKTKLRALQEQAQDLSMGY